MTFVLGVVLIMVGACGTEGETTDTTEAPTTTLSTTTTSTAASTTTTSPTTSSTTVPPSEELEATCSSPDGFTVSYPERWSTNSGDAVATCTKFHPEPFDVGEGTDERVAAINIYVENVAYSEIINAVTQADVLAQSDLTIDGHPAQRIEYVTVEDAIIPEGTEITSYFVDLGPDDKTLIANTLDFTFIDYEAAKEILDLMAETIEIGQS